MNSSFTASDKRVDLDPLAAHVRDGDCAAFGGGLSSRVPMAAVRALLRRGTGFELIVADELSVAPLPGSEALSIIRRTRPDRHPFQGIAAARPRAVLCRSAARRGGGIMSTLAVKPTSHLSHRGLPNLIPLPYRNVSMQPYDGAFTEQALIAHLLGREAYRRTEFIVLRDEVDAMAVVAIAKRDNEALFSEIVEVEILALPEECAFARSPETDCGNRSALAELAHQRGVGF